MSRQGSWEKKIWEDVISTTDNNMSQFGEVVVTNRTPMIELNSAYGTSLRRDIVQLVGSGSKDDVNGTLLTGEISLSTGATINSSSTVLSSEVARYIPGYSAEFGIGMRIPGIPIGEQKVEWGGETLDRLNGFYWREDSEGLKVVRERNGIEAEVTIQGNWNIDKLDGTGPSGYTLDPTRGNIYQVDYTWYGYGNISFSIIGSVRGVQRPIPVHTIQLGEFSGTSITNPTLQLFSRVFNGNTASDITAFLGGRQYSIVGQYRPKYRFTGDTRDSVAVTTANTPLISFRPKAGYNDRTIKVDSYNLLNVGNIPVSVSLIVGATVVGGTWATPTGYTASETAVEANVSLTSITGGFKVYNGDLVGSAREGQSGLGAFYIDIPSNTTLTLIARAFSGSQACYSGLRVKEEW
jgi:hypothetical protein